MDVERDLISRVIIKKQETRQYLFPAAADDARPSSAEDEEVTYRRHIYILH